jgi:signal transduction histidine kinase
MNAKDYYDIGRLPARVTRPLLNAIHQLGPHLGEIESRWRAGLETLCQERSEYRAMARLNPRAVFAMLRRKKFTNFKSEMLRLGESLAASRISVEHAMAAVLLWLEISLEYIANGSESDSPALALVRWNSANRLFVIVGYTNHRKRELDKLERNLTSAERHLKQLSRIITDVYDKERRRIARDLHDEVGHDLVVLKLYLEILSRDLTKADTRSVAAKLREAIYLVASAIERVRRFAFELGPAVSDELGFVPALKVYARQFAARTGIDVRVRTSKLAASIPSTHEMTLYRILQGGLSNVVRHSRARHVTVTLSSGQEDVAMTLQDDGVGFDVDGVLGAPNRPFGLGAMRERARLLGGDLEIQSRRSSGRGRKRGTEVVVRIPLLDNDA